MREVKEVEEVGGLADADGGGPEVEGGWVDVDGGGGVWFDVAVAVFLATFFFSFGVEVGGFARLRLCSFPSPTGVESSIVRGRSTTWEDEVSALFCRFC